MDDKRISQLETFCKHWDLELDLEWLNEALTHPSVKKNLSSFQCISKVEPSVQVNNDYQLWETLGDAVIDLVVLDLILEFDLSSYDFPKEGLVTIVRSRIVNNDSLSTIEKKMNLSSLLITDNKYHIQAKDHADIVESFFGVVYKSLGINRCYDLLKTLLAETIAKEIDLVLKNPEHALQGHLENNPRNRLQEFFQKQHLNIPDPQLISETGAPNNKIYVYKYEITYQNATFTAIGSGKNKKIALMDASQKLCDKLGISSPEEFHDN